jgi:hypothetical protein
MAKAINVVTVCLVVVTAAVLGVLFFFDPAHNSFYPLCAFHKITGLNCPGCGSLRTLHEMLHGHLLAALHSNALMMLTLPFVLWLTAHFLIRRWRGQTITDLVIRPWWLWSFLTAAAVFAVLRNLPEFAWLSP